LRGLKYNEINTFNATPTIHATADVNTYLLINLLRHCKQVGLFRHLVRPGVSDERWRWNHRDETCDCLRESCCYVATLWSAVDELELDTTC